MEARSATERPAFAVLTVTGLVVAALLASRVGYQPIWDGRIYADCIANAAEHISPAALRCAGHASQAYVLIVAVVQSLAPESYPLLLATNAALFGVACIGFHRLVRHAFPAPEQRFDRALITSIFALQPSFLANVVHPTLDLPLLPGFVWCVALALERRRLWMIVVGTALAFSKETGVLLYAFLLVCLALVRASRRDQSIVHRIREVRRLIPLALPGIIFGAYLLYRTTLPNTAVMWTTATTRASLPEQFLQPHIDLYTVNAVVIVFVLNFAWIMTVVFASDLFIGTVRALHRERRRLVVGADALALPLLTVLPVAVMYALTRFTTFGHPRYYLIGMAVVIPAYYASLLRLGIPAAARRAVLAVHGVLLIASALRTVDPVSRWVYGTFPVGSRSMLRMTSVTGECCGYGQDQLVYSLEFTVLQTLIDRSLAVHRRPPTGAVVVPDTTSFVFIDPPYGTSRPLGFWYGSGDRFVFDHGEVVRGLVAPDSAIYLAIPYGDNDRARRQLSPMYTFQDEKRVEEGAYAMSVYRLIRRAARP